MILIFIIAISLSMDAFSLALAYGTSSLTKKEINTLSTIVGLYHFFMPIFGMLLGKFIINIVHIGGDLIVLLIFSFIGINMIIESFTKEDKIDNMKLGEMILFGLAVSIDSFSVGIGINNINNNFLLCSLIFSIISAFFTFLGLILGSKLNQLVGKISTIVGGITLIILGIIYII